jgi:hypothetical protein
VLPLRRGVAQLHAQHDSSSGDVRRRVRGFPGDPHQLGSLGTPLLRRTAHAGHAGAEDPRAARCASAA